MAGLGSGDSSRSFEDIEYGLFGYQGTSDLRGRVYRGYFGDYEATDRFRVGVEDGVVRYRKNGVVFYESPMLVTAEQYPLVLDTSLVLDGRDDQQRDDRGGAGGCVAAARRRLQWTWCGRTTWA